MGDVFRAFDTKHSRFVALKRLPAPLADDAPSQVRFRRESELTSRLSDPHVVPIHSYGEIDGRLYIDMRLVDGKDLGRVLTDRGALPEELSVSLIEQLAGALDSAHAEGLLHRDVKPSNVLLTAG